MTIDALPRARGLPGQQRAVTRLADPSPRAAGPPGSK